MTGRIDYDKYLKDVKCIVVQGLTNKVKNVDDMFKGCDNLKTVEGFDTWDITGLENTDYVKKVQSKYSSVLREFNSRKYVNHKN